MRGLTARVTPDLVRRLGNPKAALESLIYSEIFAQPVIRDDYLRAAFFFQDDIPGLEKILTPSERNVVLRSVAKDRRRLDHVTRLVDPRPKQRIADIGCGVGGLVARCERAGASAVGIDLDFGKLTDGRRLTGGLRVAVGDCCRIPLRTASMDKVACANVFEHILEKEAVLEEFRRILRPRGRLFIYTDNLHHVMLRVMFRRILARRDWGIGYSGVEGGHVALISPRALAQQLREHGFTVKVVYSLPAIPVCGLWLSRFFCAVAQAA